MDKIKIEESLYQEAKNNVLEWKRVSTSFLQRRLKIGYAVAWNILDRMEEDGLVGCCNGAEPREIYTDKF